MNKTSLQPTHTFHIPVMGTGFTIDTPLKVARYGITSVVSIVDDRLVEKIRGYFSPLFDEAYTPIADQEPDARARRITAYLDFMKRCIDRQIEGMKASSFVEGSDACRYFEMMSDDALLKKEYIRMKHSQNMDEKKRLQIFLRDHMIPGNIDVNIMTKADKENKKNGVALPRTDSDACAALRGFAQSKLESSVVFSAGLNLVLYGYLAEFSDFYMDAAGVCKKKIILKVSDFRSALVQAKIFAKKGLWVSEYRVESGLNCGGHAFATQGHLLGPILEEFRQKKEEMVNDLFELFKKACEALGRPCPAKLPAVRLTAQGGVGTAEEHRFLQRFYGLDSVGWGSPFLLVPEATNVDPETLQKLMNARQADIILSRSSPLGIPFYTLRNSASEQKRQERIREGKPGSPCLSKYLTFNTEFGAPLCTASSAYQTQKIAELDKQALSDHERHEAFDKITAKACICRDLGDGALLKYGIRDEKKDQTPAICPGPNLAFFSRSYSLKEMVDHIYGRMSVFANNTDRPHVFLNELKLYADYLNEHIRDVAEPQQFKDNLLAGIDYYRKIASELAEETESKRREFLKVLEHLFDEIQSLHVIPVTA